jgi:hypothetical protein
MLTIVKVKVTQKRRHTKEKEEEDDTMYGAKKTVAPIIGSRST